MTTAGYDSVARCAATSRYAAHTGAIKKHGDWDHPCFAMGYDFVALSHETAVGSPHGWLPYCFLVISWYNFLGLEEGRL